MATAWDLRAFIFGLDDLDDDEKERCFSLLDGQGFSAAKKRGAFFALDDADLQTAGISQMSTRKVLRLALAASAAGLGMGSAAGADAGASTSRAAAGGFEPLKVNFNEMLQRPTSVYAVKFSVFNRKLARSALQERMMNYNLGGHVRRISTKEVKCLVVAQLEQQEQFGAFIKFISLYAPRVDRNEVGDTDPVSVFDDPIYNPDNPVSNMSEAIGHLSQVTVDRMPMYIRKQYEKDGKESKASDDPQDAVTVASSCPQSSRSEGL